MADGKYTLYRHPDWIGTGRKAIPIMPRHTIGRLSQDIENALATTQAQSILLVGKSGTGKSTLTAALIHRLHQRKFYQIRWYSKKDILNFVEIVDKLPKGVPTILVFDDASYALRGMSKEKIEEIAAKLTYIRHDLGAPVLSFVDIHYSKAVEKIFRDVFITILTSMTDNERTNILQLFGTHNSQKVNNFLKLYRYALFDGFFSLAGSTWTGDKFTYKTSDPFRPALVSSVGSCHYLLYPEEFCGTCAPPDKRKKLAKIKEIDIVAKMSEVLGPTYTRRVVNLYCYFALGQKSLTSSTQAGINLISKLQAKYDIDWNVVRKIADQELKKPRNKTGRRGTKKPKQVLAELEAENSPRQPQEDQLNKHYSDYELDFGPSLESLDSPETVHTSEHGNNPPESGSLQDS